MAKQTASNTFGGGLNLDFDLMTIGDDAYVLSQNGRVFVTEQSSMSWVNSKGNTAAITIDSSGPAQNFFPIGYVQINNLLILFLDGVLDDEIALITFDSNGVQNDYLTLMNDDAFTDKFNFSIANQIEAKGVYETSECIRAYWVDGVKSSSNPPRAFTFKHTGGDVNLASNYEAVTLSPHSVDQQADFLMGIMKFKQTIGGSIPAGQYVYSYRLVTADGYATPWYPPMLPLFVTQDGINATNWNEYEMEGTETFVNSGKGNRLEIKGIDTRYQEIEVAYVHYIADAPPFESNIFVRTAITGATMELDHVSNTGEPLDPLEIPAQRVSFTGVKTLEVKDNTLYQGNVKERFFRLTEDEQEDLLENLTIEPTFRLMLSDEIILPDLVAPLPGDPTATFPNKPLTHQVPKTGLSTKTLNQSHTEDYVINNDYVNYKGTQVSHQYSGYFRGETYRFGIVFFDEVGNPSFVYHLADVTVDDQYQSDINWTRLKADGTLDTGSFTYGETFRSTSNGTEGEDFVFNTDTGLGALSRLRILGFKMGGIDITNIKSRIRGFKIVRAELDAQIIGQGLIMPCVREQGYTTPLPSPTQNWIGPSNTIPIPLIDAAGPFRLDTPEQTKEFYHLEKDTGAEESDSKFKQRPNASCLYMPDIDFDIARVPTAQPIDRISLVGICSQKAFSDDDDDPRYRQWMHYQNYVVQKLDCTDDTYHDTAVAPYPNFGDQASITDLRLADYGGTPQGTFPEYSPGLDFYNSCGVSGGQAPSFEPHALIHLTILGESDLYAHGKNRTLFIEHTNFGIAQAPMAYESRTDKGLASYFIANYKRPNSSPYGGITSSSIEQTQFISTGHFQPVNNGAIPDPNIVNDIEVFGGDCYLDYFSFIRLYGIMLEKDFLDNDDYSDYGMGHCFPLESNIHHPLRQATNISGSEDNPMWPDVGGRPAAVFFGDDTTSTWVQNGLFLSWNYDSPSDYGATEIGTSNVEEFNISGVLSLAATLKIYFGLFSRFKDVNHFEARWRYSDIKIHGEIIDRFRIFLANNFADMKGEYGPITSSGFLFDQIYSFQMLAMGRLRAFDRAALQSQNLGAIYTGVAGALDGIDYITTVYGNQHQWSLANSGKAFYWVDGFKKEIVRFAQDGIVSLSNGKNVNTFAGEVIPVLDLLDGPMVGKGIMTLVDFENEDVIFSFVNRDVPVGVLETKHIIYSESTDRFVDTPTFPARFGLSFKNYVYYWDVTAGSENTLWLHDSGERANYMGVVYDSAITVVVNDAPSMSKVFDSIRMNINAAGENTITEIQMETQDQFVSIDMTLDTRWRYLEQILRSPLRGETQGDRMRGKWIKLTFVFDNTVDEKIIFTNLLTLFRTSNRF